MQGLRSVRRIKNWMVDKTTKRKQRGLEERQDFEGSPVREFSFLWWSRKREPAETEGGREGGDLEEGGHELWNTEWSKKPMRNEWWARSGGKFDIALVK